MVMHDVRELVVCFSLFDPSLECYSLDKKSFELPRCIFLCPFFEHLNLDVVMSLRHFTWLKSLMTLLSNPYH